MAGSPCGAPAPAWSYGESRWGLGALCPPTLSGQVWAACPISWAPGETSGLPSSSISGVGEKGPASHTHPAPGWGLQPAVSVTGVQATVLVDVISSGVCRTQLQLGPHPAGPPPFLAA